MMGGWMCYDEGGLVFDKGSNAWGLGNKQCGASVRGRQVALLLTQNAPRGLPIMSKT